MNVTLLGQSLIDGLLIGGIYGLIAIGLTLIFGVMKIINFSQGALMMLGMYVTYYLFSMYGINPYLSIPVSAAALFLIGYLIQRGVLNRILDAPEHNQLLVTLGLMMMIENFALLLFSPDFRTVKVPSLDGTFLLGPLSLSKTKLIAFVSAIFLTGVLYWFLQNTNLGKAIRATAMNRDGGALYGIKVNRINAITFGIGAALAAIAGTLITPFLYVTPTVGSVFVLKAFVVVVLGGLGNFLGALLGGLIIGAGESLTSVFLPGDWKDMATYLIFILVLLYRPTGLLGRKS